MKELYLTKITQRYQKEQEQMAEKLAKKTKAKSGPLFRHYKAVYEENESEMGSPAAVACINREYYDFMALYNSRVSDLTQAVDAYKVQMDQKNNLVSVFDCSLKEAQERAKLIRNCKAQYFEINKRCKMITAKLKAEMSKKDELASVISEAERRATDRDIFIKFATNTMRKACT